MTRTFNSSDKLHTFYVTECTALRIIDFDFSTGREIVERQKAILVEWKSTKGLELNALIFGDMPRNNKEFNEMFENELDYSMDPEIMRTIQI